LGTTRVAFEPEFVREAVEALGPERVVFGSNGPSIWPDLALESLKRLNLGAEAEALIFGETLARIYGVA
jgi:predicted TIM-barrel fold metal-dependent hydrolase